MIRKLTILTLFATALAFAGRADLLAMSSPPWEEEDCRTLSIFPEPPQSFSSHTWDSQSETGTIHLDISSQRNPVAPFHYLISTEEIPSLQNSYDFLKDTANLDVDSLSFFSGFSNQLTHDFTGLSAGTYHLAVFDANRNRLLTESFRLQGELKFDQQTGLTMQNGNQIVGQQNNGQGSLQLYTIEEEDVELRFATGRTNPRNEQFMGLSDEGGTVNGVSDLKYGFVLQGNNLFTVDNGVRSANPWTLPMGDEMKLVILDGVLTLEALNQTLLSTNLPAQYTYKAAMGMPGGAALTVNYSGLQQSQYKFKDKKAHLGCDQNQSYLSFAVDALANLNGSTIYFEVVHQGSGQPVAAGASSPDDFWNQYSSFANSDPLTPGIYVVSGTIGSGAGSVPFTREIYLGYQAQWASNTSGYTQPNSHSVLRTAAFDGNFSTAVTQNVNTPGSGWIEFHPQTQSIPFSSHYIRFQLGNFLAPYPSFGEGYIMFKKMSNSSTMLIMDFGQAPYTEIISANARLKMVYAPGSIKIYVNDALLQSYSTSPLTAVVGVKCQSKTPGDAFLNVATSFSCSPKQTLDQVSFAELHQRLDAGRTLAVESKLKFTFDGEYDVSDGTFLAYKIYDDDRVEKASADNSGMTSGGGQQLAYRFDDNRYILDLSTISGLVPNANYLLEMTDSKGGKKYLKFLFKY